MDLVVLPSSMHSASPARSLDSEGLRPLDPSARAKSARLWCATLRAPCGTELAAAFFATFPQKHQVVVGLEHSASGNLLLAMVSTDLHSLGTVIRKVQNSIVAQLAGTLLDTRFEELEESIKVMLAHQGGSFKVTKPS